MEDTEQNFTALDELEAFAGQTHSRFWSEQLPYPGSLADRVSHSRKAIYIQDHVDDQCFWVGFHDPKAFGEGELFFGVFFPVSFSRDQSFLVKERDLLDKLRLFTKHRSFKTGVDSFDKKMIITGTDSALMNRLLNSARVQELLLEAVGQMPGFRFGLNAVQADFVPAFQQSGFAGLFTLTRWMTLTAELEALMALGRLLHRQFNSFS